uniref:Uncharacterized protein n=1 Tax=Arundo donax TaxID=35708 RepID=A0A0A8Z886_ARUDO
MVWNKTKIQWMYLMQGVAFLPDAAKTCPLVLALVQPSCYSKAQPGAIEKASDRADDHT